MSYFAGRPFDIGCLPELRFSGCPAAKPPLPAGVVLGVSASGSTTACQPIQTNWISLTHRAGAAIRSSRTSWVGPFSYQLITALNLSVRDGKVPVMAVVRPRLRIHQPRPGRNRCPGRRGGRCEAVGSLARARVGGFALRGRQDRRQ